MDLSVTHSAVANGLAFAKMHACGNDFVVVDDRAGRLLGRESEVARDVCRRHLSLGADGLLLLRTGTVPGSFGMVFVNADGLVGEMCGNGARCLAAFIHRQGLARDRVLLQTLAGDVAVVFQGQGVITLELPLPVPRALDVAIKHAGHIWHFDALDVGPPHVVTWVPDLASLQAVPVLAVGRYVRHHAAFAPRGCNVNFATRLGSRIHMRTYERGVEDETLGCGTGATAVVLVAVRRFALAPGSVQVVTRSGDVLGVDPGPAGQRPLLSGGAHFVARGVFEDPALDAWQRPAA